MKHKFLLTMMFASLAMFAQSEYNPALKNSWKIFKSALHEKNDILRDFTSAIKKGNFSDSTLMEETKIIGDYFNLRLGQSNLDADEIRTLLDSNKQLDERFSKVIKTLGDADKLTEIEDFLGLQSRLGWAMNRIYVSADGHNEIAKRLGLKDLHIELHNATRPPKVKF